VGWGGEVEGGGKEGNVEETEERRRKEVGRGAGGKVK